MDRSKTRAGDERRPKPRKRGFTSPAAASETTGQQTAPSSGCAVTTTVVLFATLALLFAGAIGGPAGMPPSFSAGGQTQPVGLEILDGTGGRSGKPASAAVRGGSSTAGMRSELGSTDLLAADRNSGTGSGAWNSPSGVNLNINPAEAAEACPACGTMFGNLTGAKRHVELQLRGEPKSGTSFMYEWAVNALMVTCSWLSALYGRNTCRVSWRRTASQETRPSPVTTRTKSTEMKQVSLLFEPKRRHWQNSAAGPAARCACENVESVSVTISSLYKHDLPVCKTCPWQHVDDVTPRGKGCTTVAGRPVQNYTDTAGCLHESPCKVEDTRLQMLILRDPRAVVVSSFFYLKTHKSSAGRFRRGESADRYAVRMLPTICRFVHLRWLLLRERLADRTVEFMYDESLADPLGWHERWLSSVGLTPPKGVVQEATDTALRKEYGFAGKGVDEHPGGKEATPTRTWQDEISPEVVEQLNGICRVWLPPMLLDMFGIA